MTLVPDIWFTSAGISSTHDLFRMCWGLAESLAAQRLAGTHTRTHTRHISPTHHPSTLSKWIETNQCGLTARLDSIRLDSGRIFRPNSVLHLSNLHKKTKAKNLCCCRTPKIRLSHFLRCCCCCTVLRHHHSKVLGSLTCLLQPVSDDTILFFNAINISAQSSVERWLNKYQNAILFHEKHYHWLIKSGIH